MRQRKRSWLPVAMAALPGWDRVTGTKPPELPVQALRPAIGLKKFCEITPV